MTYSGTFYIICLKLALIPQNWLNPVPIYILSVYCAGGESLDTNMSKYASGTVPSNVRFFFHLSVLCFPFGRLGKTDLFLFISQLLARLVLEYMAFYLLARPQLNKNRYS